MVSVPATLYLQIIGSRLCCTRDRAACQSLFPLQRFLAWALDMLADNYATQNMGWESFPKYRICCLQNLKEIYQVLCFLLHYRGDRCNNLSLSKIGFPDLPPAANILNGKFYEGSISSFLQRLSISFWSLCALSSL